MEHRGDGWYQLDNAGTLYPAIQREDYSAIYRFSAQMTELVNPEALRRAISLTMPRFPGFCVSMRRGVFWHYLVPNVQPGPFLKADVKNPCQPVRFREDNGWLVRFYYYQHRISLEVFHALSDGAGALTLFRTLLAVYLRELGHDIPDGDGVLDIHQPPRPEEWEDAYTRYATREVRREKNIETAFPNLGTEAPFYTLNVVLGVMPVDQLLTKARSMGATVTEYLAGVLLWSILENQRCKSPQRQRPVALAIPVNLRGMFPSDTLRNFILGVRPVIDPSLGEYSLEEIVKEVHHYMRLNVTPHKLRAKFSSNVRYRANKWVQIMPLAVKNPALAMTYRRTGLRPFSATYTNPGAFHVPTEMEPHIQRMELVLGQAGRPRPTCASISYGNVMVVTFAGNHVEPDTERVFFRRLVQEGISVKIESNREE